MGLTAAQRKRGPTRRPRSCPRSPIGSGDDAPHTGRCQNTLISVGSKCSPRRHRSAHTCVQFIPFLPLQIELSVLSRSPSPIFVSAPGSNLQQTRCSRRDAPPQSLSCHSSALGAGLSASDEKSGMNCLRVSGLTAFARHAPTSRAPPTASFVPRPSPM